MVHIANRLAAVKPSASMAVSGAANALKAQGHDVIDLGLGEPDFDTPGHIIEAAYAAGSSGDTRYTPTVGALRLREAVREKFARENDLQYGTDEIIISNGAKQVIFDALMATLEPGEKVLLCAPHFDTYKTMTSVLGGNPVILDCDAANRFQLRPETLEAAIDDSTRWLFLNSPSNPAGAVYSEQELQALGEVLQRHPQVLIMSDEIYEHILFDGLEFVSFGRACPQLRDRLLCVNGVSKAYAMTGWRIGYGAGPADLITAMTKVQSQISSGPSSISQAAATAALEGPQDHIVEFRDAFERRRNVVVDHVARIPSLTLDPPGGAFYTFVGCHGFVGSTTADGKVIADDVDFAHFLLDHAKVAVVPGSAYSMASFVRLSTATSEALLADAMTRIAASVSTLQRT